MRNNRASQACRDRLARLIAEHVFESHAEEWLRRVGFADAHGQATMLGIALVVAVIHAVRTLPAAAQLPGCVRIPGELVAQVYGPTHQSPERVPARNRVEVCLADLLALRVADPVDRAGGGRLRPG